jgi:transcriptional regulator of heat shock response
MMITERQGEILNRIVQEYIELAEPVSSQLLEKKYDFDICSATIRIEMQKLTDTGFLLQPHTSAGRIPTDKGYRFFVDELLKKEMEDLDLEDWFTGEIDNTVKSIQLLTKNLALASQSLVLSYFEKEKILWKEGWEEIFKKPEFREETYIVNFTGLLESFEEHIEDLKLSSGIKVYIGRENPFKKTKDFSIISSSCCLPGDGQTIISLLGPKRMDYDRNINLMKSLAEALAEAREE